MGSRSYLGFKDYTVLGSRSEFAGSTEWQVVLWSKSNPNIRACCVVQGEIDRRLPDDCLAAVRAALEAWEKSNADSRVQ
jgi:hypothetical protein